MRSSFFLSSGAVLLLALAPAYVCFRYAAFSSIPKPIASKGSMEFKEFAVSKGLLFHSGNVTGFVSDNYFLADHPVTLDDLERGCTRRDCGLTLAWRGILWVCQINSPKMHVGLAPESIGGKWRVWGNVLVAGDEALMDRIEELYANQ